MAIRYMSMAWKLPLSPNEILVLLAISDASNDDGYCYPGYESLMSKTKLAKSTLAKTLSILEGAGLFEKEPHSDIGTGRKVNTYRLLFNESWFESIPIKNSKSMRIELIESTRIELIEKIKCLRDNKKRAISSHLGQRKVHTSNPISSHLEHESSYKPSLKQPSVINISKKRDTDFLLLSEYGLDDQLSNDFIKFRKGKRAEITKTSMDGFVREAGKAGISVSDAVRISIERNWTGFNAGWDWRPRQAASGIGQYTNRTQQNIAASLEWLEETSE